MEGIQIGELDHKKLEVEKTLVDLKLRVILIL
jgi:hypothetical protein